MAQEDEQDDAARAFEDLSAEVRVMRRAVEALEAKKPTDYAPTLAEFAQKLEKLTVAMVAMAERPALALTPDGYTAQLRRAQDDGVRAVSTELQRAQTLAGQLDRTAGAIRTREEQRRWVVRAAIGGMAAGVFVWALVLLPMARILPDSWSLPEKLAAGVVGTNRWTAGESMMASYAPEAWSRISHAAELEAINRKALDACRKDAEQTGRAQRCSVQVSPPTSLATSAGVDETSDSNR